MSNAAASDPEYPDFPRRTTVEVEKDNRVTLNRTKVYGAIPWLGSREDKSVTCYLKRLGTLPAVQVFEFPPWQAYVALFDKQPARAEESAESYMQLARALAEVWEITLEWKSKESRRLRIPVELQELGILPRVGEKLTVFAFGNILELWTAQAWRDNFPQTSALTNEETNRLYAELNARKTT